MDRAQRRQRRLDQKIWRAGERAGRGRGRSKQLVSEASNCESTDQTAWKCGFCGVGGASGQTLMPSQAGAKSLCSACDRQWQQRGTMAGGNGNGSAGESTDDITVYEAGVDPFTNDLQAKLHLSDVKGLKWQKISVERAEENRELRTEIECLNLKIKEITEARAVRHGQLELESKLRAENQTLKEKNNELVKVLNNLYKRCSSDMETVQQVLQETKSSEKNNHQQAGKGVGNAGRNVHESIAEVNVCNGDRPPSKQTGNSERNGFESVEKFVNGCESAAKVNVDMEQQNAGYPQVQQQQHMGGNGSGNVQLGQTDVSPTKSLLGTEKSGYLENEDAHDSEADLTIGGTGGQSSEDAAADSGKPNAPRGLQPAPSVVNRKAEDMTEILFTAAERKAALALVDQEFLMWLNSRTRRPTAKEMSSHKSHFTTQRLWPPGEEAFYWTGIPGSLLLEKFHSETAIEKPSSDILTSLLRSVFHIEGSKRAKDMLWCLVWADCMNRDELPGYVQVHPQETKRARAAPDYDVATRSAKSRHLK